MIKVYIASPYTKGDVAVNVKTQMDTADELMNKGFVPFTPLYSHFQHMAHPRPYEDWLKLDFEWIPVCDCILRLPGDSSGADNEVEFAITNNILVFYSLNDLCKYYNGFEDLDESEKIIKHKTKSDRNIGRPWNRNIQI